MSKPAGLKQDLRTTVDRLVDELDARRPGAKADILSRQRRLDEHVADGTWSHLRCYTLHHTCQDLQLNENSSKAHLNRRSCGQCSEKGKSGRAGGQESCGTCLELKQPCLEIEDMVDIYTKMETECPVSKLSGPNSSGVAQRVGAARQQRIQSNPQRKTISTT